MAPIERELSANTKALNDLRRQLHEMTRLLSTVNENLVEFARIYKEKEESDGSAT